jgi:hypothetical protein
MNSTNPLRPDPQEGRRAFGKDITNICRGALPQQLLKKGYPTSLPLSNAYQH